jgi:hypothetical protein
MGSDDPFVETARDRSSPRRFGWAFWECVEAQRIASAALVSGMVSDASRTRPTGFERGDAIRIRIPILGQAARAPIAICSTPSGRTRE